MIISLFLVGPVWRHPLKSASEYHISYLLEEAIHVLDALKNSIYWDILITKEEKVEIGDMKSNKEGKLAANLNIGSLHLKEIYHDDDFYEVLIVFL